MARGTIGALLGTPPSINYPGMQGDAQGSPRVQRPDARRDVTTTSRPYLVAPGTAAPPGYEPVTGATSCHGRVRCRCQHDDPEHSAASAVPLKVTHAGTEEGQGDKRSDAGLLRVVCVTTTT